jgi:hypothetical protein
MAQQKNDCNRFLPHLFAFFLHMLAETWQYTMHSKKEANQMSLLTKVEAAAELGIEPETLDNWRWRGKGPAYVKLFKEIRYDLSELRKFIAARTRQPSVQSFMEERSAL